MVKVSVVIPVYNPGHYLHACVESLLAQTMPAEDLQVIFVDDGSTDESPAYLDEMAAAHPQLQVIHQANSGWPGQPRNVGISRAVGEYVFFCDHDDWFLPDALERLYAFAVACGSDVVLPKMAGLGRRVPHHVFGRTRADATLAADEVMDSLTPHKLFRRALLDEHQIRFPEGKRRLEDHLFVVTAYLKARVISIYADSTCYVHIRRDDSANAGFRKIEWPGYFDNLAESLDVVVAHTEAGPLRDSIYRRWLQVEMVNRLTGERMLKMDEAEAEELLGEAHRVGSRYFGEGVVALLEPLSQQVARAILANDFGEVRRRAEATAAWDLRAEILDVAWRDQVLQVSGTFQVADTEVPVRTLPYWPSRGRLALTEGEGEPGGSPGAVEPPRLPEVQLAALLGVEPEGEALASGLAAARIRIDVTDRRSGASWPLAGVVRGRGLTRSFTVDLDPFSAAGGEPLADGLWDVAVQVSILGLALRRRATLVPERQPGPVLPIPTPEGDAPKAVAYYTKATSGLALDVGLIHNRQLRPKPAPSADATPPAPAVAVPAEPAESERPKSRSIARRTLAELRRSVTGRTADRS